MAPIPNFLKNNVDMLSAAGRCIEQRQHLPALVLIYSHIDTLAWAASSNSGGSVRARFEAWADRWLIPHLKNHAPEVTSTDLYAARCGVLHTLTGASKLSERGAARQIIYAWGSGDPAVLRAVVTEVAEYRPLVALHYQELLQSLRLAVADFIASADDDGELAASLLLAESKHYTNIPNSPPEDSDH